MENEKTRNEADDTPKELQTKTKDGREFIYLNGDWEEKRLPKPKATQEERNIPIKLQINDGVEITGKAYIKTLKGGGKAYVWNIEGNQQVYGGGTIFIRV